MYDDENGLYKSIENVRAREESKSNSHGFVAFFFVMHIVILA